MSKSIHVNEAKNIPFNQIEIPEEENARSKLERIPELAASIQEHGLETALTVVVNKGGDKPYKLQAGFRRAAALTMLKWGERTVPCTITEYDPVKNLVENIEREELHAADLAQRLHDLETGEYPGHFPRDAEGKAKTYSKAELVKKTGLSNSHVTNYIRAHKKLIPAARRLWKSKSPPLTQVFKWAGMSEAEQEKAIALWKKNAERIEELAKATPKKRGARGEGEGEGGKEETPGFVKGRKQAELETELAILEHGLETGMIKGAKEVGEAQAAVKALRFVLGNLKTNPFVNKAMRDAYAEAMAEEEEVEEAEEDDEAAE